jgi:hypothetical protein
MKKFSPSKKRKIKKHKFLRRKPKYDPKVAIKEAI